MKKFTIVAITIIALAIGFFVWSPNKDASDVIEMRRYDTMVPFMSNVYSSRADLETVTADQEKLQNAFEAAMEEKNAIWTGDRDTVHMKAFIQCGVEFPEGTWASCSIRDGRLWIKHYASTLNKLEHQFGLVRIASILAPDQIESSN